MKEKSGGVLLEFTAVLPLALLLISATVELGFGFRKQLVLANAAVLAARIAAHDKSLPACNSPGGSTRCTFPSFNSRGEVLTPGSIDSVSCLAKVTAYEHLMHPINRSQIKAPEIDFSVNIKQGVAVGGFASRIVEVDLREKVDADGCILCFKRYFSGMRPRALHAAAIFGRCA